MFCILTLLWKNCRPTRAHGSTEARHECGTAVVRNRAGVTSSRELQSSPTQMLSCSASRFLGTTIMHCASARANGLLRTVCPDNVWGFAGAHYRGLWECVCTLLNIPSHQDKSTTVTLPMSLGGLGLRSAVQTSPSVFWASWADQCSSSGSCRHDHQRVGWTMSECSFENRSCLVEPPSWISLANGAAHTCANLRDYEHGGVRQGWQREAASRVERVFWDAVLMPRLASHEQALLRSQNCPMAGAVLTCVPPSPLLQFPQLFRILLLRRLRLPLPLTSRVCRCGRQIGPFGHHCREAGSRVTTNVMLRLGPVPSSGS